MAGRKKSKIKNDNEWVSVQDKRKGSKAKRGSEGEDLESDVFRLENDEIWICQSCKIRFEGDNHMLVECEYCVKHFCVKCIHMTEMEYKIMNEKERIHWFCPPCDEKP